MVRLQRYSHGLVWMVIVFASLIAVVFGARVTTTGALDGWISTDHRPDTTSALVMMWIESSEQATTTELLSAANRAHERFRQLPVAAPANELTGWESAHSLLLLPRSTHNELEARLTDTAIDDAIARLQGTTSSPFFGFIADRARRDPLRLEELTPAGPDPTGGQATGTGDLLARDGQSLLMLARLDDEQQLQHQIHDLDRELASAGLRIAIVGPVRTRAQTRAELHRGWPRAQWLAIAWICFAFALTTRQLAPPLALATLQAAFAAGLCVWFGPINAFDGALLLAAITILAAVGSINVASRRTALTLAAVVATAWVPLYWSEYPLLATWALRWPITVGLAALVWPRLVPAGSTSIPSLPTTSIRWVAPLLVIALTTGAWTAFHASSTAPLHRPITHEDPLEDQLHKWFFDPAQDAWVDSAGPTKALALDRAAQDAALLTRWAEVRRIDGPGHVVVSGPELAARKAGLAELHLDERLAHVETALTNAGFRPGAFGEFLRSTATEIEPSAEYALSSPLGPWIDRYIHASALGFRVRTTVTISEDPNVSAPVLVTTAGHTLHPQGPVVAARGHSDRFRRWFPVFIAGQLWAAALIVWLIQRDLLNAVLVVAAGAIGHSIFVLAVFALGYAWTPLALPCCLIAGLFGMLGPITRRPELGSGDIAVIILAVSGGFSMALSGISLWMQLGSLCIVAWPAAAIIGQWLARPKHTPAEHMPAEEAS